MIHPAEPFSKRMDRSQCRYYGAETTMILRYLCILLCLLGGASLGAQVAPPTGAWRQTNVAWKKPPAELKSNERYAEAAVLYFSPIKGSFSCMELSDNAPLLKGSVGAMAALFT